MSRFKSPLVAGTFAALALISFPVAVSAQDQAAAAQPIPVEVWSLRDVVNAVQMAPDGKHILVHKVESREGDYVLEIYRTEDLIAGKAAPYRRLAADPMEIISARWVSDNYIFGNAWQVVRNSVKGPEEDIREYKAFSYNLAQNKFSPLSDNFELVNILPKEPDAILVASGRPVADATGVDPFAAFRPNAYYRLNLNTGARSLVLKGSEKFPNAVFDNDGNPRFTQSVDPNTNELINYYRLPGDGSWKEMSQRYDYDEHKNLYRVLGGFMGVAGFSPTDPTIGYVIDNRDEDKAALWEFDFKTQQFGKKLFQSETADVMGIQLHTIPGKDTLAAAIYPDWRMERHWFDKDEEALYKALEQQIPQAHQLSVSSRSRDGKRMIVSNRGPRDPGSFWLITEAGMAKLGSRNPLVQPEQLADVDFIWYTARDGKRIPAYVTKPKGKGPFPLIVLPHGGPHVNEVISYDEWGQLLANNGYMVLQPQYRMSVGWGQDLFDSAYGQHGLAMQDDKDDGAKALVQAGWADPERIAMFGWSYGGYASLVALSRENNIYQCAIAGAAVADPEKVYFMRRPANTPKAIDDWAKRRGMIGINPIKEVSKVNIPLLMVHGDDDRRVLYFNFTDYKKEIEKYGKPAQFLTLEDADHFYVTLMYKHQEQFYTKMLDFLRNDCGPGGL